MLACLVGSDGPSDCQVENSVLLPREGCWRVLSLVLLWNTQVYNTKMHNSGVGAGRGPEKRPNIFSKRTPADITDVLTGGSASPVIV